MSILDVVLGRRLASSEQDTRQIGWFEAVAAMGLDAVLDPAVFSLFNCFDDI